MLDLIDKALDQVPFAVPPAVIVARRLGALVRWDDRYGTVLSHQVEHRLASVAAIGDHALKRQAVQQRTGLDAVVALAGRQAHAQRIAQGVDEDVDLGAEAPTAAPQRLL